MMLARYIEFCKSTFAQDLTLKGLKIVVDAAHGAAYHCPKWFHELGADVVAIGCAPDGLNINHEVGPPTRMPWCVVRPTVQTTRHCPGW